MDNCISNIFSEKNHNTKQDLYHDHIKLHAHTQMHKNLLFICICTGKDLGEYIGICVHFFFFWKVNLGMIEKFIIFQIFLKIYSIRIFIFHLKIHLEYMCRGPSFVREKLKVIDHKTDKQQLYSAVY